MFNDTSIWMWAAVAFGVVVIYLLVGIIGSGRHLRRQQDVLVGYLLEALDTQRDLLSAIEQNTGELSLADRSEKIHALLQDISGHGTDIYDVLIERQPNTEKRV